ncbi:sugar phosphate isomerase/epimerase [Tessaracoccus terricola]
MTQPSRRLFAASTLGVMDEDLPATVATMQRHGVRAVEIRSAEGAFVSTASSAAERAAVRRRFTDAGIEVLSVASGVRLMAEGEDQPALAALSAELQLAADLGAPFVRVFPGAPLADRAPFDEAPTLAEPTDVADERGVRRLLAVIDEASRLGVSPLLETHDSHARGEDLARILTRLDTVAPGHPVGAIWDVLHPWRVGEELSATAVHLGRHITQGRGYVQIKDVPSAAAPFPTPQGEGVIPGGSFLEQLDALGYAGPISLEWERFWEPTAVPLDEALAAAARFLA